MRNAWRWFTLLAITVYLAGFGLQHVEAGTLRSPQTLQSNTFVMVSPSVCPSSGCAAGERFNLQFDYELSNYSLTASPNVKVCFYAPTSWGVTADQPASITGEISGASYQLVPGCDEDTAQPTGYNLITAREAAIDMTTFSDTITISLRLSSTACRYRAAARPPV